MEEMEDDTRSWVRLGPIGGSSCGLMQRHADLAPYEGNVRSPFGTPWTCSWFPYHPVAAIWGQIGNHGLSGASVLRSRRRVLTRTLLLLVSRSWNRVHCSTVVRVVWAFDRTPTIPCSGILAHRWFVKVSKGSRTRLHPFNATPCCIRKRDSLFTLHFLQSYRIHPSFYFLMTEGITIPLTVPLATRAPESCSRLLLGVMALEGSVPVHREGVRTNRPPDCSGRNAVSEF
ncbi:hypothetical protein VNO77_27306 [Canavalia gladiata]|uniref:Uncharacterized protein n=1 Tax=Canavalia gladiata TaxID=3824 RepID=A0AAN9Q6D1_CANGL